MMMMILNDFLTASIILEMGTWDKYTTYSLFHYRMIARARLTVSPL